MTAQLTRQQRRKAERKALAEGWVPFREIQPDATTIAGDMSAVARRSGVSEDDVREAAEAIFETAKFYASDKIRGDGARRRRARMDAPRHPPHGRPTRYPVARPAADQE